MSRGQVAEVAGPSRGQVGTSANYIQDADLQTCRPVLIARLAVRSPQLIRHVDPAGVRTDGPCFHLPL
eukprot:6177083-Pleurochrysis_carterae.AAC.7